MFLRRLPAKEHGGLACLFAAWFPMTGFPERRRLTGSCEYHTVSAEAFQPGSCPSRLRPILLKMQATIPTLCTIPGVGDSACVTHRRLFRISKVPVKS